ncbi:phosphatidylinositol 3- and 4-kinase family protein [Babesia bovis T2Bo]|uniref:Phosphatidylinositol 3-and 4-kinase family protein n=1 Tax=Babesia bovis TaxID=5865 RepID=A7ANV1_BABBO|nr:phosphatidylinositol 3- and 4-kinase family protein [Babesia bovis T2Bo]EDO08235.1 phosphatidylinositol 3- and 4-kinase family protein [Babesia bovis T2Bo]|eukprot:XP_001611803.1 phosphatidylinositol 3- and 4-kinase family protein [Babesia bovis T2Bo]
MSSGGLRISQQNYFSTHNALRDVSPGDKGVRYVLHELHGERHGALRLYPFYDVQMVKRMLIKKLNLSGGVSVADLRILYKGVELPNYRTMETYMSKGKTDHRLFWSLREKNPSAGIRRTGIKTTARMDAIINEIALSLKSNIKPKLTMDGTGGTYLMYNKHRKCCAVFKPIDEEAFAPCNPRGYEGTLNHQGFRSGVLSGEGASREVAAYLLDSAYGGVCGVPDTTMVEASHPCFKNSCDERFVKDVASGPKWKPGSLQEFIDCKESSGNYNPALFSVGDVHRIGIFDIRVVNLDRNDGNILVMDMRQCNHECVPGVPSSARYKLIPIDHGLILPDVIDVADMDLVWFEWPQSEIPFSKNELRLIFAYNPDKDAERLRKRLLIRPECLRTMRVSVRLLQIGAAMHLNLKQIARIMCRSDMDDPSDLECMIKRAVEQAYKATEATSVISTRRLGHTLDLISHSVKFASMADDIDHGDSISGDRHADHSNHYGYESSETSSDESFTADHDEAHHVVPAHHSTTHELKYRDIVRTTYRRRRPMQEERSIWVLEDSKGHQIHFEWDQQFEHIFYAIAERMFAKFIQKEHPEWSTYPYNGEGDENFPWSAESGFSIPNTDHLLHLSRPLHGG